MLLRLWNSPTFTTWGNQAAQSLRLLAITPLILVKFDSTEISVWYLFSSLTFLGDILSQRVSLTFSRLIAFAMGGAKDLSPIKEKRARLDSVEPNWPLVNRSYGTIGALNGLLTAFITISAIAMGMYGLSGLLTGYQQRGVVWGAFLVLVLGQSVKFFYQRYAIALRGMNYVALSNRWSVVFSLASICTGFIILCCGGGLVEVVVGMQIVALLSIPRDRFLLLHVESGRFKAVKAFRLDREIISWAWEPFWKGFLLQFANRGVLSLSSIFVARYFVAVEAASILITIRLMSTLKAFCDAPLFSVSPRISRMIAQGGGEDLRNLVRKKFLISQILYGVGLGGLMLLGPVALSLIGANAQLVVGVEGLLLATLAHAQNIPSLLVQVPIAGNNIICFRESIIALLLSLILAFWGSLNHNIFIFACGVFVPRILLIMPRAYIECTRALEVESRPFAYEVFLPFVSFTAVLGGLYFLVI
jgi:hypothetical protein